MPTVLITGTSTGIGRVTAEVLAQRGWQVFATMRDLQRREKLEVALKKSGLQDRVEFIQLDLNDAASIEAAVATVLSRTGGTLDAVVQNAGVSAAGAFEDLPGAEIRRVMETNFFGVLELTRALLPSFRAQGDGRILLVSSEAAFMGQPANSIYCASKWALEGWAESLAYDLEPFGIKVILIEPGPYRTQIWRSTPWIVPSGSPYRERVQRVSRAADEHAARSARDPKEVALVIARALEAKRPRFRYPVGPFARINHFLRGKVPSRLIRRGVSRYLGLMKSTDAKP
ncbi:MAG TPA: SDR family oxidoreductase [Methyloceanibacter sp.]|jgi:NAD(P)-dependent dehydrogenase (short-subunit alcohol dehydrogenase family)|nr:SDR family oxidoreductase [Methyloceanibacter sp.]